MKPKDRAPLATNSSAIERPAPILSHDTGVTHSFFTAVLKEITGIRNLASVCAALGERMARALTIASTR